MTAVSDFRTAQSGVVLLAERELQEFYESLNHTNGSQSARALQLFVPELVTKYGEIVATLAADFFESLREEARVTRPYKAVLSEGIPTEQSLISANWAVSPLFRPDGVPDVQAAFSNLTDVTDRLVKQNARDTIALNTQRDPAQARWARVPSGSDTCTFCLMLASRGAVYSSESRAKQAKTYHGKCNCVPRPIWNDDDIDRLKAEEGYDPDEYYDRWQEALEAEQAAKANTNR